MSEPDRIPRGSKQRPRKDYPYYKIQVYEERLVAWQDMPKAHQTLEAARKAMIDESSGKKARIMIIEGDRCRRPLE